MKKIDTVYIIEDDAISSFIIKRIVDDRLKGKESIVFENGQVAIKSLKHTFENGDELPDLIFLDINMPIMDGWEFLEALRVLDPQVSIPIFILTSSINPADMEKAKSYQTVKGFLSKPFTYAKLDGILN
jgi:CheY-like chemotaxis protein